MNRKTAGSSKPQPQKLCSQELQSAGSEQQQLACHIHTLPDEVLEKIFYYLSIDDLALCVAPVCQRWQEMVQTRCFSKELTLDIKDFSVNTMLHILRAAPGLQSLKLTLGNSPSLVLHAATKYCRELRCLDVHETAVVLPISFLHSLQQLNSLTVHSRSFSKALQFCKELGTAMPNIRKLNFNSCQWFRKEELAALVVSCPQLVELRVDCCCCTDEDVKKISERWGPSLRGLELMTPDVTDTGFAALVNCSQLQELTLDRAVNISAMGLQQLATLKQLEVLILAVTRSLTKTDWCQFFTQSLFASHLRVLNLYDGPAVDDTVLAAIAASCLLLEMLELLECHSPTDRGVGAVLRGCKQLQHLNISSCAPGVWRSLVKNAKHASLLRNVVLSFGDDQEEEEHAVHDLNAVLPHLNVNTI